MALFFNESGGHRWQRIPPTEKKGRVQTSTVTVAVLTEPTDIDVNLNISDCDIKTTRGSGPGGQHRNVTDTCVQITHKQSGIQVRAEDNRSQHINKENALQLLRLKLIQRERDIIVSNRDETRKNQVGSGMRGDKVRTVQEQNDRVTNHSNGKTMRLKMYLRGNIREIL